MHEGKISCFEKNLKSWCPSRLRGEKRVFAAQSRIFTDKKLKINANPWLNLDELTFAAPKLRLLRFFDQLFRCRRATGGTGIILLGRDI